MAKIIQIRDVPDDVHDQLSKRAEAAGMSLSRYALRELEQVSRVSRNAEIFRAARERPGRRPTPEQIVADIRAERDRLG